MRVLCWLVCLVTLAPPLGAQTDPRLADAVRLAREGLGDSARAVAGRVLNATRPSDALYPEALFTVARVAATVDDKRLYLQRVAIEFSQSDWADDARLELAQLAYAERKFDETVRHVERLLADYPLSSNRGVGALWGSRAAYDLRQFPLACQWAAQGLQVVGTDVELRNQLDFQRQRCEGALEAARSGGGAAAPATPAPPTRPGPVASAGGPGWYVQVAAFREQPTADGVVQRLARAQFTALVVRDGGFFKVRAGPYPTRAAAQEAIAAVKRAVGGEPFVVQVR